MEQGADICSGKLAGAAGSSQPRACRGKANPQHSRFSLPDIPFLLADSSQVWEGRAGLHEIQMCRAKPKGNLCFTKVRKQASSPRVLGCSRGVVGLCEENLGSHRSKGCCAGGPDPEQAEIKGKADLGSKEVPETALLSELFSACVQMIGEWSPWETIPWNCSVALCSSRYFEKHQQDLPVVLYPQVPLTKSLHSLYSDS